MLLHVCMAVITTKYLSLNQYEYELILESSVRKRKQVFTQIYCTLNCTYSAGLLNLKPHLKIHLFVISALSISSKGIITC